ncbi:MAG TPA: NlpC/P60 family protein [Gaiellales bacterium]|nr:NlpC/P60 family protein [Gaiellales bacterium]
MTLATLWTEPGILRPIDQPSATRPVDIPRWLSSMSTDDRRWLVGRIVTQASYGVQVAILGHQGAWTKVAVRGQPTPLNRYGYPGWLPTVQLTTNTALAGALRTHPVAVVSRKIAWLRSPDTDRLKLPVTYATRLAVVGTRPTRVLVMNASGGTAAIASSAVRVYSSASAIPAPTGARIVASAKRFIGLPYLWAGTSAYGFDCSGLTYTLFRRFGIGMPRDADRQALHGTPVAASALRPGDLVFFATNGGSGTIHHVAIYAGNGDIVESPNTGAAVRVVALAPRMGEFTGARRYL